MNSRWRRFRRSLFPKVVPLIYFLANFIGRSVKLETPGWNEIKDSPRPIIFAGWHGRSFLAATFFSRRGYWIIASHSRDGEIQNQIFRRFGFLTIRGSSGRDGVRAAIEAIRVLKTGARMALTPDGPRGPSGVCQPGIVMMAQKSGALVVPVGVSSKRRWLAKSWDRYLIPKPFSRAIMYFADPIEVPEKMTPEEAEEIRILIQNRLDEAELEAERRMGFS